MKRLGALIAAVLLVVIALWVRGRLGGDGVLIGAGEVTGKVACATELWEACEAIRVKHPSLEIDLERAGLTTDGLAAADERGQFDVWLVPQASAAVAEEILEASRAPSVLGPPSKPIAHSRLGMYVHETRSPTLSAHCGGDVTWGCLLTAVFAGTWQAIGGDPSWGPIKPYVDPRDAAGLLALGGAAASVVEAPIDGLAIRDNASFAGSLASLKRARVLETSLFNGALGLLTRSPAITDVVVTFESAQRRLPPAAAAQATLFYPAPVVSAEIVAVPRRDSDKAERLMELLTGDVGREALASTGWDAGPAPAAQKNSPSVGSHIVLREIWEEIR